MIKYKPVIIGAAGAIGLFIIFLGIITLVNHSFAAALQEFSRIWYWGVILATGFGVQLGLYAHIRSRIRQKLTVATAEVAASGTISTGSMLACCAHVLVNLLPVLGISAAAAFLLQFQLPFILIGVFSNLIGITVMAGLIQKHHLFPQSRMMQKAFRYDMRKARNILIPLSVMIIMFSFWNAASQSGYSTIVNAEETTTEETAAQEATTEETTAEETETQEDIEETPDAEEDVAEEAGGEDAETKAVVVDESRTFTLAPQTNNQQYVSVRVEPRPVSFSDPVAFDIALNTHSVALDYDLTKIAALEDDQGNLYEPVTWKGSPPGGHHRSGTLFFPKLQAQTGTLKLVLRNISNVPERIFTWTLQ